MMDRRRSPRASVFFLLLAAAAGAAACSGSVTPGGSGTSSTGGSGTGGTGGHPPGCPDTQFACVCPDQVPAGGSSCDPCCSEPCSYAAGTCGPTAQCSPNGTWSISVPPCPPPAPEPCWLLTTPPQCASAGACRWLVPGCGTTGFTAGCFDAADCTPGAICPSGQSCIAVDTDPCWDSNCTTCSGGQADVCSGPG